MLSSVQKTACCAVFDIGKTNIKLSLISRASGDLLTSINAENRIKGGGEYPCVDTEYIWQWLKSRLMHWSKEYEIDGIGITTHGATLACVKADELVLPIVDYEFKGIDSLGYAYKILRPKYEETLSPELPLGLNLGAQLYWLQSKYPAQIARTQYFLLYPQYWAYRLSGRAVTEVTSLGCHTDLWNPNKSEYSSLVLSQGWKTKFPALHKTGASLGSIRPQLAKELGLPSHCKIYNGIHDSNASLAPHLLQQRSPFAVVSSGTWTIIAGIGSPTGCLIEAQDMLANVNAFGEPVPSIRFMGGREWQCLAGAQDAQESDFQQILQKNIFALPAFSEQGGPYRQHKGEIVGAEFDALGEGEKTALATLYLALMTDHCLGLLQQQSTVIVEGAFAGNHYLLKLLAQLRPNQQILFSKDATGTSDGTARLCNQDSATNWPYELHHVNASQALNSLIQSYKQKWHSLLLRKLLNERNKTRI
ncbi:Sugar (pentulose or hexulose) kinase [Alteromonadaceae bacterium Bs31]|nr:Sugar (pentulose or hexulose) kinase [Alteromonadaceae bacterium Bs31]